MGSSIGSMIGQGIGNIVGSQKARRDAKSGTRFIKRHPTVPTNITTGGGSSFNAKKGSVRLDPSIRAGQETFLENVRGLRDSAGQSFDEFQEGIGGLRDEVAGLRESFEGNQSAFREQSLNPLRRNIANRRGALDTELNRTNVRGSFADQSRNNFELAAGRELSDQEARIENERINNLGNLLNMDADLLKASLGSETGRTNLLLSLEKSLQGISTERFAQEMMQLGLPAQYMQGLIEDIRRRDNAEGVERQADAQAFSDLIDPLRQGDNGGTNSSGGGGFDFGSMFGGGSSGGGGFSNTDTTSSIFQKGF